MQNNNHEIIKFPNYFPITIFVSTINNVDKHWHQSIELLFVLNGTLNYETINQKGHLETGDCILFNTNEWHQIEAKDCCILTVQIKISLLKQLPEEITSAHYSLKENPEKINIIKNIIAKIISNNIDGNKFINIINESLTLNLIYELYANFKVETPIQAIENASKLNSILNIINNEYNKDLSLPYIAEKAFLSIPYLSRFFKKNMNMTITEYIKEIRLRFAVEDLYDFSLSLQTIAEKNGFPNSKAFVEAFKEKYNILPSTYRKKQLDLSSKETSLDRAKSFIYQKSNPDFLQNNLNKFLQENLNKNTNLTFSNIIADDTITIDLQEKETIPFIKKFKKFIGVSRAHDLLQKNIQEQLITAQKEIGYEFIKMHSILDDDMMVYDEDNNGNPVYNFTLIDIVFDFLISINIKPLVQLSFMPSLLASDNKKFIFKKKTNTSAPNSIRKWNHLIQAFLEHLVLRYQEETVNSWLFTLWNEPSIQNSLFGLDFTSYQILFSNTYEIIKKVLPNAKFGGPATFTAYKSQNDWLENFLDFLNNKNYTLDFILIHYYDIELSKDFFNNPNYKSDSLWLSKNPNSFVETINIIKNVLKKKGYDKLPLYITEWNSTTSHRDLLSDTTFKSTYIVKNIVESNDLYDGIGYWLLSDFHEELTLPKELFHGGLGMFTKNGFKKPAYFAFLFLNKLGDRLIERGKNYIITSRNKKIIILLFNYIHYSNTYAEEVGINTNYENRYNVFPNKKKLNIQLNLNFARGDYELTKRIYNQDNGSVYDLYSNMGSSSYLTDEETEYIKNRSIPTLYKKIISGYPISINTTLTPLEIQLIELKPILTNLEK